MSVATDTARVGSWVGSPINKRLVAMGIVAAIVAGVLMVLASTSGTPAIQATPAEIAAQRWEAYGDYLAGQYPQAASQPGQAQSLDAFWRELQTRLAAE